MTDEATEFLCPHEAFYVYTEFYVHTTFYVPRARREAAQSLMPSSSGLRRDGIFVGRGRVDFRRDGFTVDELPAGCLHEAVSGIAIVSTVHTAGVAIACSEATKAFLTSR